MTQIELILGREILDSRGNPTVEADVILESGARGRAAVPSGASTGEHEALELRDGDKGRYAGKGVLKAVNNINEVIAPELEGMDASEQREIDNAMLALDGTPTKSKLGANAILAVSMATARAMADHLGIELYQYLGGFTAGLLPTPMMNILNGGAHADNNVDFQEFMVMPVGASSFSEALRWGVETFHVLKGVLKKRGYNTAVGDEGGFAPSREVEHRSHRSRAGGHHASRIQAGRADCDCARSCGQRVLRQRQEEVCLQEVRQERALEPKRWCKFWADWVRQYPIVSLEDGFAEDDWDGWKLVTDELGSKIQLVGDDIFVTNIEIFQRGIDAGIANSILIKLNQIGSVSETHGLHQSCAPERLHGGHFASLGRDGRHLHRRLRRRDRRRTDQDGLGVAHRSHRQVQPAAAHRRRARPGGAIPGTEGAELSRRVAQEVGTEQLLRV